MAAAIMATMQLVFTHTHLLGDAGCVCTQAYQAVSSVHVHQSGLVIDKIPGRSSTWGLRGRWWQLFSICDWTVLRVPVAQPGGSSTIEPSPSSRPSFPSSNSTDTEAPACTNWIRACWTADSDEAAERSWDGGWRQSHLGPLTWCVCTCVCCANTGTRRKSMVFPTVSLAFFFSSTLIIS